MVTIKITEKELILLKNAIQLAERNAQKMQHILKDRDTEKYYKQEELEYSEIIKKLNKTT